MFEVQEDRRACFTFNNGDFSTASGLSDAQIQACLATLQAFDTANFCGSCDALCGAGHNCNYNPDGLLGGNQCN